MLLLFLGEVAAEAGAAHQVTGHLLQAVIEEEIRRNRDGAMNIKEDQTYFDDL